MMYVLLYRKPAVILKLNHVRYITSRDADYCMQAVRKYDYENFLSTLLLPATSRAAAFALRAFNIELAQIKDLVSDPKIGLMRLEFWKKCVDQIYAGSAPHSPVAKELLQAVQKHKLTKRWLQRVIEARPVDMELMQLCDVSVIRWCPRLTAIQQAEQVSFNAPFMSVAAVEQFAESSNSSINFLLLESVGVRNVQADHAASHIGKAHGFVTLIRALPYHARQNNVYLPIDLMIKHQVSQEDIIRGCREQKVKDLTFDLASEAHKHMSTAASFKKDLPPAAPSALLHAVSTRSFLKAIQRVDFDPFDSRLQQRNNWLPLIMWMSKFRKTF